MQKYLFTTDNGTGDDGDALPLDLPSDDAAANEAQKALADMAKEGLPCESSVEFRAEVRDDAGRRVYKGSLKLNSKKRSS